MRGFQYLFQKSDALYMQHLGPGRMIDELRKERPELAYDRLRVFNTCKERAVHVWGMSGKDGGQR
jgi:hypothetical protein